MRYMGLDSLLDPRYVSPAYNPADYERPSVTTDVALLAYREQDLQVLLIRRKKWPYQDFWALPGGFVGMSESLEQAARRELREETGVSQVYLEQLYTFGDPDRDPRTRVISVAYLALANAEQARQVQSGDDAAEARWWSMTSLPPLAFDHDRILRCARQRLHRLLEHTTLGRWLLPASFTLGELQTMHEVVFGERLDKRNFRRKMLAAGVLEETGDHRNGGLRRPARLYRFTTEPLVG